MEKLILASQSPRRKQLLEWADIDFEVVVQTTDESYPPNLSMPEVAIHIAYNKAVAVQSKDYHNRIIISADTIVVLDNEIIGKPFDRNDALTILNKLSGNHHKVITGVCILGNNQKVLFSDSTDVEFHNLSVTEIEYYVDKYQPYDKAGAYAIQEWIGVVGIKSVTGDFYNVMGLPVSRVVKVLRDQFSIPII